MHGTLVELEASDLLTVRGDDSKQFLQGQVSCNLNELSGDQSLIGALCNVKGRVIADFRLVEYQQTCYLQMAAAMAAIVKPALDKYIVFSKAETSIATGQFLRYGLMGNDAHRLLQETAGVYPVADGEVIASENYLLIKIPGLMPRYEIWQALVGGDQADGLISAIREKAAIGGRQAWELEDIQSGIAHITPPMSGEHLPETLNYDLSGVINFKKGCYTGQEIVARMFYRGTAKKRLFHGHCKNLSADQLSVTHRHNDKVVSDEIIKLLTTAEGDCHVLAILPTDAVSQGTRFHFNDNPELALELLPLPYIK